MDETSLTKKRSVLLFTTLMMSSPFTVTVRVSVCPSFLFLFNVYCDMRQILIYYLSMVANDNISNSSTAITYIHTYTGERILCTDIHNIDRHSYTIKISGSIVLFGNKWAKGTKYIGLYSTSVGNVLITELGHRSEFLKRIVNC